MINEFSSPEAIEEWAIEIFWETIDCIPETEGFSDLMVALTGVRVIKRASRRWNPEKLSYGEYLRMALREEFAKAAHENRYITAAESALALVNRGRR